MLSEESFSVWVISTNSSRDRDEGVPPTLLHKVCEVSTPDCAFEIVGGILSAIGSHSLSLRNVCIPKHESAIEVYDPNTRIGVVVTGLQLSEVDYESFRSAPVASRSKHYLN
jgi:hypothetical protein